MIRLQTFGYPALFADGGVPLNGLSRQTRRFGVFIYLACEPGSEPRLREDVIATFWPDADSSRGRNALRQALHVIREEIGPEALVADGSQRLWLDPDRFTTDVGAFTRALDEGSWERALSLYRGDFLKGFLLHGSQGFEQWVEGWRAIHERSAVEAAQHLAHRAEGGRDLEGALYWWRWALDLHPFDESLIRRIVCLLAGSGNCGEGMAEFQRFRSRLRAELDVTPSQETLDLVGRVCKGQVQETEIWMRGPERDSRPPWRRPSARPRAGSTARIRW
jgi:DNA-binding SARP family transcriptional activator